MRWRVKRKFGEEHSSTFFRNLENKVGDKGTRDQRVSVCREQMERETKKLVPTDVECDHQVMKSRLKVFALTGGTEESADQCADDEAAGKREKGVR